MTYTLILHIIVVNIPAANFLKNSFKAIGLNRMIFGRTFLWMLPGLAMEILALVLLPVFIALLYTIGAHAVYFSYPAAELVAAILSVIIMTRTYQKQIAHLQA